MHATWPRGRVDEAERTSDGVTASPTVGGRSRRRSQLAESVGCVEIDNAEGGCSEQQLQAVHKLGSRLNAMLTSLTR